MADRPLDLIVRNVRVVRSHRPCVERLDIGNDPGQQVAAPTGRQARRGERFDRGGRPGFPGVVDAHTTSASTRRWPTMR